jgi:hypothetical protein
MAERKTASQDPAPTPTPPAAGEGTLPGFDAACAARWPAILLGVALVAAALRVAVFAELSPGPCLKLHRLSVTDMHFFDLWAKKIAGGDVLVNAEWFPKVNWMETLASEYLSKYPDEPLAREALAAGPAGSDAAYRVVWGRWYAGKTFYQEPLYAYLVAITYRLLGEDPTWVLFWQMAVGVAGCVVTALVARRCFGAAAGAVAGAAAALCPVTVFYEVTLLRESLIAWAGIGLVWLMLWAAESPTARRMFALGAALGAAMLLKSTYAVAVAGLAAAWLAGRLVPALARWGLPTPGRSARDLLPAAAGLAAALSPLVIRNVLVGAPPLAMSAVTGINVGLSSVEGFEPEAGVRYHNPHLADVMAASEGRLLPAFAAALRTHPSPLSYGRLVVRKILAVWHWFESPDNVNPYYFRLHSAALSTAPVTFWVIAPAALAGLAMVLARPSGWAAAWPAVLMAVVQFAPLAIHMNQSRYRLPLLVALVPFAAWTAVRTASWAAAGRWPAVGAVAVPVALLAVWMARPPYPPDRPVVRPMDCHFAHAAHYLPAYAEAAKAGDHETAAALMAEALSLEPDRVRGRRLSDASLSAADRALVREYGRIRFELGRQLAKLGRTDDAEAMLRLADDILGPESPLRKAAPSAPSASPSPDGSR